MISRTRTRPAARARAAFTLPELLVVVTVTLVLMSILVQASTIITNTVSEAKAQGDFVGQERMALAVMRRDLQYDHFIEEDSKPNLGRKVSDQGTEKAGKAGTTPDTIVGYKPPRSGYFWAYAPLARSLPYNAADPLTWNVDEGTDSSGFGSSRAGSHFMQFTIVVPGGAPQNTITADVPMGNTNVITGTCAEVAYFLVRNGTTPGGVQKYKLIRRQRLAARNTDDDPAYGTMLTQLGAAATDPPEVVACRFNAGKFDMFNLNELTQRANRVAQQEITAHRVGEDVLLNHVTSFELKFTGSAGAAAGIIWPRQYNAPVSPPAPPSVPSTSNTDFPYDALPYDGEYDTGDDTLLGNVANLSTGTTNTTGRIKPIRITGVQIRLRCWNPSNKQTRQTTTIVDL